MNFAVAFLHLPILFQRVHVLPVVEKPSRLFCSIFILNSDVGVKWTPNPFNKTNFNLIVKIIHQRQSKYSPIFTES